MYLWIYFISVEFMWTTLTSHFSSSFRIIFSSKAILVIQRREKALPSRLYWSKVQLYGSNIFISIIKFWGWVNIRTINQVQSAKYHVSHTQWYKKQQHVVTLPTKTVILFLRKKNNEYCTKHCKSYRWKTGDSVMMMNAKDFLKPHTV